ncbi:helix-turn-helix transcriptional regulator [Agromyces sp. Marseille-Q5079]|uniref:helix-turn-helix transcriptional regulator n=1 Tax=Agromyces sp. Marseille-Q5079 TaxID=3439059 RepID=UPI003D9CAD00
MTGLSRAALALRDPEEAERALADYFPSLQLGRAEPGTFRSWISTTTASQFSLVDYGFASAGSATAGSDDLVVIASAGQGYVIRDGRNVIDTTQPFLSPDEGLVARWDTLDARVLMLSGTSVERVAQAASGRDDFRLVRRGTAPVSQERARYWAAVVRGVRDTVADAPDAFDSPLVAEAAFHHLATAFLHVFPTSWIDLPEPGRVPGTASVISRSAIEFMRAHAGQPITMEQVAASASVSTRGLHRAFVHELGEPPAAYLRRLRLQGARIDLLAADHAVTVVTVARRWGFAHASRFAQAYRRAFGEYPSETLRR